MVVTVVVVLKCSWWWWGWTYSRGWGGTGGYRELPSVVAVVSSGPLLP